MTPNRAAYLTLVANPAAGDPFVANPSLAGPILTGALAPDPAHLGLFAALRVPTVEHPGAAPRVYSSTARNPTDGVDSRLTNKSASTLGSARALPANTVRP